MLEKKTRGRITSTSWVKLSKTVWLFEIPVLNLPEFSEDRDKARLPSKIALSPKIIAIINTILHLKIMNQCFAIS